MMVTSASVSLAGDLHATQALAVRPLDAVVEHGGSGDGGADGDEAVGVDQHGLLGH